MLPLIRKSILDILSPLVLKFVLKVGLGSIFLWVVILGFFWDGFSSFIGKLISKIPFVGGWEWFQTSGAFISALFVGYMMIIITISLLTSLYSESILIKLAATHYPNSPVVGTPSMTQSLTLTLKSSALFMVLFLVMLPLLFVPIVGQIWVLWLWSILIKDPTTYDVGSLFIADKYELRSKSSHLIATIASTLNYIPLLNIFAPLFGQILFLHHILRKR
jgi:Etoposide-induced protein 2.4 (EI24)